MNRTFLDNDLLDDVLRRCLSRLLDDLPAREEYGGQSDKHQDRDADANANTNPDFGS